MAMLSVNELTTYRWSFEEDAHNYVRAGFSAMGVWRPKLSDYGEEKGVELLKEVGLSVSSLNWVGGFTGSDGRSYEEAVADARDAIRLAAELGAGCLIVYSGSRSGHTHSHARRLLRNAIRQLLPIAEEFNVTLAIEPMHQGCARDWTFLTSLAMTIEFLEEFSNDHLQLSFDTYHFGYQPISVDELARIVPYVALVQVGDAKRPPTGEQNRCPLGQGVIPIEDYISDFRKAGYDGFFEVELLGEDVEAESYTRLLSSAKSEVFRSVAEPLIH